MFCKRAKIGPETELDKNLEQSSRFTSFSVWARKHVWLELKRASSWGLTLDYSKFCQFKEFKEENKLFCLLICIMC